VRPLTLSSAIAVVLLVGGIVSASAANWLGTNSPSWNDPLNWEGSSVPDAVGDGIYMVGDGSTTFTATITNDVAGRPVEILVGGWYVQTNSLSTGLGNHSVDGPNTATINSYTNLINPANGSVFYRMVYP
jgi:hypothetical protein